MSVRDSLACVAAAWSVLAVHACAAAVAARIRPLDSGLRPADVPKKPYLDYARECIDLLIEHGTDRYGKTHSPMLVSILDIRTRDCPANPLPLDESVRVSRRGRRNPAGGNLYTDQPTLRTMHALSTVTGDEKYAAFASRYLAHYLKNHIDEKGFLWWGWHRHVDAHRDIQTGHSGNHHEIHIQQIIWPILWEADSGAVSREIEAIWKWHIIDKATGECNRHGDGQRGCDFAMSGGEMLYAFAFLHTKTGERKWLDRARLVANYYWKARDPKTNLIPNRPNAGRNRFDGSHFDTSITGFLCHRLLRSYEITKDPLFREQAVAYLKAYAKYAYDRKARRFWGSLKLDGTPVRERRVVGGYAQYEPRSYIDIWQPYAAGYEHAVYTAQAYAYAYDLTRDPALLEAAKRWAECILRVFPARGCEEHSWYGWYARTWAPHGTYAGHYGRTVSFLLQLHAVTGEKAYLKSAKEVANEAIAKLYYRGLLRGHPCKPYYEAMDGVGYLLCALIQLDQASPGRGKAKIPLGNW